MNKEDLKLIKEEIDNLICAEFKNTKITKKLIDGLMNKYNNCSYNQKFYDSEPSSEDEKGKYEAIRKTLNNWSDPYSEGIWGYTRHSLRKMTRELLNQLKQQSYEKDRFYYIKMKDDAIILYFYGRDLECQCDYWFCFFNSSKNDVCSNCKKRKCYVNRCKRHKRKDLNFNLEEGK